MNIELMLFMKNIEKCNCDKIHMVPPPFLHAVIGITDEVGEIMEILKRALYYGDRVDDNHLMEEYGDMMFYILLDIRRIAENRGMGVGEVFQEVLDRNVAKLEERYKEGFTEGEATESGRDRGAERKAMDTSALESLEYNKTMKKGEPGGQKTTTKG